MAEVGRMHLILRARQRVQIKGDNGREPDVLTYMIINDVRVGNSWSDRLEVDRLTGGPASALKHTTRARCWMFEVVEEDV